ILPRQQQLDSGHAHLRHDPSQRLCLIERDLERSRRPETPQVMMATLLNPSRRRAVMRTIGALLLTVLLVVVGFVAVSYLAGRNVLGGRRTPEVSGVGTTGKVDVNAARERGAEVGEKVAVAAEKVRESAAEAAVTSKIKAKMVLDDYVKARAIDVTTHGSTVTLSGKVRSADERARALRIARETAGVTGVVDQLSIEK